MARTAWEKKKAYMAPFSDPGLSAQVGAAGLARLLRTPEHVGPSQQGGGPPRTRNISSEALQSTVGCWLVQCYKT